MGQWVEGKALSMLMGEYWPMDSGPMMKKTLNDTKHSPFWEYLERIELMQRYPDVAGLDEVM